MHETILRLVTTSHASYLMETFLQAAGPLIVAVVGTLLLAGFLRRLLFKSVAEGGAGIDRRFLTDLPWSDGPVHSGPGHCSFPGETWTRGSGILCAQRHDAI